MIFAGERLSIVVVPGYSIESYRFCNDDKAPDFIQY